MRAHRESRCRPSARCCSPAGDSSSPTWAPPISSSDPRRRRSASVAMPRSSPCRWRWTAGTARCSNSSSRERHGRSPAPTSPSPSSWLGRRPGSSPTRRRAGRSSRAAPCPTAPLPVSLSPRLGRRICSSCSPTGCGTNCAPSPATSFATTARPGRSSRWPHPRQAKRRRSAASPTLWPTSARRPTRSPPATRCSSATWPRSRRRDRIWSAGTRAGRGACTPLRSTLARRSSVSSRSTAGTRRGPWTGRSSP